MSGHDERGSGSPLALIAVLLAAIFLVGSLLAGVAVAALSQVRGSADLVAVSAATARAAGGDPCQAAADLAAQNQVELTRCDPVGDELDFVVTVEVTRRLEFPNSSIGADLAASANAGWLRTIELE